MASVVRSRLLSVAQHRCGGRHIGAYVMTLRDYLYIDESKLDLLAQQVRTTKKETVKRGKKISLSITGLGVELSEEDEWRELSTHEKIEALLAHLTVSDLLDTTRPLERHPKEDAGVRSGRPFVLETSLARRVIIPTARLTSAPLIIRLRNSCQLAHSRAISDL
jgi:hypothetical protein